MCLRVPAFPMEQILAAALGLTVPELFAERYTPDGKTRLHRVCTAADDSGASPPRNVKHHGSAQT